MLLRITTSSLAAVSSSWTSAVAGKLESSGSNRQGLARAIGCSRQYLAKILDGAKPTIPVEKFLAICRELDLDPNEYATPDKDSPPWQS